MTHETTNRVIVVGMLDTMLVRDQHARRDRETGRATMVAVTRREGRERGRGGRWESVTLQVRSPYGGMFAMPIELTPDVAGAALLGQAEADQLLAVEGSLQLVQTFDSRYASDRLDGRGRSDRGNPTRSLALRVSAIREPNEQEQRAGSAVWLEGEVAEPPQITRHAELPSLQLAGTILHVMCGQPTTFAGAAVLIQETVEVNLAIPTTHPDAEAMYRQGNQVRVVGQLDCRMEYQGGQAVRNKLAELDAEWAARKGELAGTPGELRRAEAQYLRVRQRYEASPRLYVLVGKAELVRGEGMGLADTHELRRAFVQARRERQHARRERAVADRAHRIAAASASSTEQGSAVTMQEAV